MDLLNQWGCPVGDEAGQGTLVLDEAELHAVAGEEGLDLGVEEDDGLPEARGALRRDRVVVVQHRPPCGRGGEGGRVRVGRRGYINGENDD